MSTEKENLELDNFWDESPGLEMPDSMIPKGSEEDSTEETDEVEETEEVDDTSEEEFEEESEENKKPQGEEESDEEEEEEIEEDEVIANSYEVFKDSIFKYLPEDYEFKPTEEGFEDAVKTVEKTLFDGVHNQYLNQIESNPKAKSYLEFLIATKGQGDFEKWQRINSVDISNYTEDDIKETEVAKAVVTEYYKTLGMEDEDILQKLEDLEDFGSLEKEAKLSLKYLPKEQEKKSKDLVDEYQSKKKSREEVYESNKKILEDTVNSLNLPKDKKGKVVEAVIKPVRLRDGSETTHFNLLLNQVQSNPEHILQLSSLLLDYDPEKGFNIDSIITKRQNTKTTKSIREKLEKLEKSSPISKSKSTYGSHKRTKTPDITEGSFI